MAEALQTAEREALIGQHAALLAELAVLQEECAALYYGLRTPDTTDPLAGVLDEFGPAGEDQRSSLLTQRAALLEERADLHRTLLFGAEAMDAPPERPVTPLSNKELIKAAEKAKEAMLRGEVVEDLDTLQQLLNEASHSYGYSTTSQQSPVRKDLYLSMEAARACDDVFFRALQGRPGPGSESGLHTSTGTAVSPGLGSTSSSAVEVRNDLTESPQRP